MATINQRWNNLDQYHGCNFNIGNCNSGGNYSIPNCDNMLEFIHFFQLIFCNLFCQHMFWIYYNDRLVGGWLERCRDDAQRKWKSVSNIFFRRRNLPNR